MFGKITQFAIEVNRITVMVLIGIPIIGFLVFLDFPRLEDPSVEIREAIVTAFFPGMNVYQVEELITLEIEEKIREIGEVEDIWSFTKDGGTQIHLELQDWVRGDDIPLIWKDLRNKMLDVAPQLPAGTFGPFVNDDFGLTAVATIAIWSDGFSLEDMRRVARDARRKLDALEGVEQIETFGVQQERVFLDISNARLARLGIRPGVIAETLRAQNIILPGGEIDANGRRVFIEPSGTFNSVAEIADTLIPVPGSDETIPLRDIVTVARGYQDPADRPVFFNGRPAVVLSVSILDGVNAVEFGERLTRSVDEIELALPFGFFLEYATFQPTLVEAAVNGAVSNLAQTLVIVLVVVVLFLGLRTGLIVGSFVPLVMLLGLIGMSVLDVELQRMSIATMIIALGMMVDNAIVMAENIRNRIAIGEDRKQAAIAAGRSLGLPLLTSTLTTILAFMPIALAIGSVGEYTVSIGQVVILVLLGSWFMSLYMTPTVSYWFMKAPKAAEGAGQTDLYDTGFYRRYKALLETIMRNRTIFIIAVIVVLVGLSSLARNVVQEFFPPNDRNQFLLYIDLEAGAHIDETTRVVQGTADWLLDESINPEITGAVAYAGSGGPRFFLSLSPINPDPHVAFILVETESNDQVPQLVERTRTYLDANFPEAQAKPKALWFGPSETGLVEFRLSGPNEDVLIDRAEHLLAGFRAIPGTVEIEQDWENRVLKADVKVDQTRARRAGVTSADIANTLNAFVSGAPITDYREGDAVIPVVFRGEEAERNELASLRSLDVYSSGRGTNVPLTQIADIQGIWVPYTINRRNLERTVTVSAKHLHLQAGQLVEAMQPALDSLDLPPGYRWELGGELENAEIAQGHLFANFPLAGFLIIVLLTWQFNSFRRAGIILLTIPMAFVGSVVGLVVMGAPFGFMPLLGLLSLAGIIINNGIVLIDSIKAEEQGGSDTYTAIVTASVSRLRPILMTTITTLLGLAPLIVWNDPLFSGMAVVISFGLAFGTLLTLGVVPVIYSLFFRVSAPARA